MEEFILENRKWELRGIPEKQESGLEKLCTITLLLFLLAAAVFLGVDRADRIRFPSAGVIPQQVSHSESAVTLDMEQSMALGAAIGAAVGAEYGMISYTDSGTCFMDTDLSGGVHLLTLSNVTGVMQYRTNKAPEVSWYCGTREQLLEALAPFALRIPNSAVFTCEGSGWHSFTVIGTVMGDQYIEGTVRCRYAQDGAVKQVESDLRSYPLEAGAESE